MGILLAGLQRAGCGGACRRSSGTCARRRRCCSVGFGRTHPAATSRRSTRRAASPSWSRTQMLGYAYLLLGKLVEGQSEAGGPRRRAWTSAADLYPEQLRRARSPSTTPPPLPGVSRSWLYRGFQRRYGKSPLAYLEELRMQYAAQLLRDDRPARQRDRVLGRLSGRALFFQSLFPPHGPFADRLPCGRSALYGRGLMKNRRSCLRCSAGHFSIQPTRMLRSETAIPCS